MSAHLFPKDRFLPNRVEIDVFGVREFYGDLSGHEFGVPHRQPDLAIRAFADLFDQCVSAELLACEEHLDPAWVGFLKWARGGGNSDIGIITFRGPAGKHLISRSHGEVRYLFAIL